MAATESLVREFIAGTFPTDGTDYPGDTDLLQAGVIDSIGVLTLVTWLEEAFGFVVNDEDVVPENLGSVDGITAYVERKLAEAGDQV